MGTTGCAIKTCKNLANRRHPRYYRDNWRGLNSTDDEIFKTARRRVKARRIFTRHVLVSVFLNIILVGIYALTSLGGYFWPMWTVLAGITAIFVHGIIALDFFSGTYDESVDKEYNRIKNLGDVKSSN
ncbi:MAG: 2TM domain-containing protein [Clostridiales bacterium]|nr:2TM domain-containing protein [Clostridiales bacterium]